MRGGGQTVEKGGHRKETRSEGATEKGYETTNFKKISCPLSHSGMMVEEAGGMFLCQKLLLTVHLEHSFSPHWTQLSLSITQISFKFSTEIKFALYCKRNSNNQTSRVIKILTQLFFINKGSKKFKSIKWL